MNDFFSRLSGRIREMMTGRYGMDEFSKFLLTASAVCLVLSFFFLPRLLFLIALAGLIYVYVRAFSRDISGRYAENVKFLEKTEGVRKQLRIQKKRIDGRKDFRFFKCPGCGQEVRVPKGKGHIRITCPKCGVQFDRTV